MYKVTITHPRMDVSTPFFWETDLANHEEIHNIVTDIWNGAVQLIPADPLERNYSNDGLVSTRIQIFENMYTYYDCKKIINNHPKLLGYWKFRNDYNYENNIFKNITEEEI